MARLPDRGADAVVVDLEDATPPSAKEEARTNVRSILPSIIGGAPQVFIRVNAVDSPWFVADIAEGLVDGLSGIVVPKIETTFQLDQVQDELQKSEHPDLRVLSGIETALGVADARVLLAHPIVMAAYFGAEDFIEDMGGVRTRGGEEVAYARSQVALAARLAGVASMDQVVTDFSDDVRFREESIVARAMGYDGKLCIHPCQVAIANGAFMPSAEEIAYAQRLLAAFDQASASGVAAIDFEGQMVDEPLAARARRTLARANSRT